MNGDIDNNQQRPVVTSVGNAWVICNSKSRPGCKYYFNTLSGQAVWNLSPEEIEKAKRYTKALPISEIEKCPEPLVDPPMDHTMNPSQAATSRIYNEPLGRPISNQVPNMFPMSLLNVNSMPGVPNIHGLNPIIWNNPPGNPAMAPTPVIYVAYPQMNFQQPQEYPKNLPMHLKEESDNYRKPLINNRDTDMFTRSNRMHDMREQGGFRQRTVLQSNWNGNSPDLRQKLIRKRTKSVSSESAREYNENCSYQDSDAHRNIDIQRNSQETPSKYDLSVLDQLKAPHSRASHWFIVVDTEIILRNFPMLDKITDPDQDCYLMVPNHVMMELQQLVLKESDVQTRRIFRFLSQQIEAELVFQGEHIINNFGDEDNGTSKMLTTCYNLAAQNNVILLSNDNKYQMYKNNNSNIHILTFNELKQILNNARVKQTPLRMKSPTLGIKIVVPNNVLEKTVPTIQRSKTPDFDIRSLPPKRKETIPTRPIPPFLKSADNIQKTSNITRTLPEKHSDEDQTPKTPEKRPNTPSLNQEKREIKLFRSTSCNASNSAPTKSYRWRKRRISSTKTNAKSTSGASDQAISTKSQNDLEDIVKSSLRAISPKPVSSTQAPSLDRSSISSRKDTIRPNIIIEETSTSGVISNTTLDSDSVPHVKPKTVVSGCDDGSFEIFTVVGQSMEEVLRTRRDEWVLRFVQIMEETLKEILRADSPFESKYNYSLPWAADLPELSKCIIKKFSDHFNVVDAANRLSFKLQKISNDKGTNIEPDQYMHMYSFGVYLIRSLMNVNEDCEDLNTADQSLKKLMFDIQNANLEICPNDTFADELNESVINTNKSHDSNKELHEFPISDKETGRHEYHNTDNNGNVSSRNGSQIQISKLSQQNVETNFFSSLSLTKRSSVDTPSLDSIRNTPSTPNASKVAQTPPPVSPSPKTPPTSPYILKANTIQNESAENNQDLSKSNDLNLNTDGEKASSSTKTCFVRNFNSIPQFEEKLNKKVQTTLPSETPVDEYYDEDDYDANYEDYYQEENGELYCDNELEDGEIDDQEDEAKELLEAADEENTSYQPVSNEKFEWFIKEFTDEIKQTIKIVLMLCTKFSGELKNSHEPSQEMQNEMKTACTSMSSIKDALDRILDGDAASPENNILHMLRKANLNDYVPSKELLSKYINIIAKCSEKVNTCYNKVTLIMQAAGIQHLLDSDS